MSVGFNTRTNDGTPTFGGLLSASDTRPPFLHHLQFRAHPHPRRRPGVILALRTLKTYRCPVCGAEIPDLPMPVLRQQLSHARRRPYAGVRETPVKPDHQKRRPPSTDGLGNR